MKRKYSHVGKWTKYIAIPPPPNIKTSAFFFYSSESCVVTQNHWESLMFTWWNVPKIHVYLLCKIQGCRFWAGVDDFSTLHLTFILNHHHMTLSRVTMVTDYLINDSISFWKLGPLVSNQILTTTYTPVYKVDTGHE